MTAKALNQFLLTMSPGESSAYVRERGVWLNAKVCENNITNLFMVGVHAVQETLSKKENSITAVRLLKTKPAVKDVFELLRCDSEALLISGSVD